LGPPSPLLLAIRSGLRRLGPAGVAALATAAVALSVVLFLRIDDLGDENDQLRAQVLSASQVMDQLRQIEAVRSAPDVESVALQAQPRAPEAIGTFYWSESIGIGVLVCSKLAPLAPGQVYQMWLFADGQATSAGTFTSWQGIGHVIVDLTKLSGRTPDAIGVSIEAEGGSWVPSSEMILLGRLPKDY